MHTGSVSDLFELEGHKIDEGQIRKLVADRIKAVRAKDIDASM